MTNNLLTSIKKHHPKLKKFFKKTKIETTHEGENHIRWRCVYPKSTQTLIIGNFTPSEKRVFFNDTDLSVSQNAVTSIEEPWTGTNNLIGKIEYPKELLIANGKYYQKLYKDIRTCGQSFILIRDGIVLFRSTNGKMATSYANELDHQISNFDEKIPFYLPTPIDLHLIAPLFDKITLEVHQVNENVYVQKYVGTIPGTDISIELQESITDTQTKNIYPDFDSIFPDQFAPCEFVFPALDKAQQQVLNKAKRVYFKHGKPNGTIEIYTSDTELSDNYGPLTGKLPENAKFLCSVTAFKANIENGQAWSFHADYIRYLLEINLTSKQPLLYLFPGTRNFLHAPIHHRPKGMGHFILMGVMF